MRLFHPIASVRISATASSSATAWPGTIQSAQVPSVRLHNAGPSDVYVAFGASGVSAAADGTSMVIPAGNTEVFGILPNETHIAAICATGETASLHVTRGEGA